MMDNHSGKFWFRLVQSLIYLKPCYSRKFMIEYFSLSICRRFEDLSINLRSCVVKCGMTVRNFKASPFSVNHKDKLCQSQSHKQFNYASYLEIVTFEVTANGIFRASRWWYIKIVSEAPMVSNNSNLDTIFLLFSINGLDIPSSEQKSILLEHIWCRYREL